MKKIINRPVPISINAYDDALDLYRKRLRNVYGVQSINTMGSVGAPGLSDIDVLVVVDDKFQGEACAQLSVAGIDERLFIHGPIVVPRSLVSDFQYIIYATNIVNISGESCIPQFAEVANAHKDSLRVCYLIDFLESRFLQFAELETLDVIDQRVWLTRLWSLTHSVDLIESIGKKLSIEEQKAIELIRSTRKIWLECGELEDASFRLAMSSGKELSESIFSRITREVYSESTADVSSKNKFRIKNKEFRFVSNLSEPHYEILTRKLGHHSLNAYRCWHNHYYMEHLKGYRVLGGEERSEQLLSSHSRLLSKRCTLVNLHQRWLSRRGRSAISSLTGYLGVPPVSLTVKNRIKRTLEAAILQKRSAA